MIYLLFLFFDFFQKKFNNRLEIEEHFPNSWSFSEIQRILNFMNICFEIGTLFQIHDYFNNPGIFSQFMRICWTLEHFRNSDYIWNPKPFLKKEKKPKQKQWSVAVLLARPNLVRQKEGCAFSVYSLSWSGNSRSLLN